MAAQKERKLTPVGEAKWAYLSSAKPAFKDDHGNVKGDPKFQIDVVFGKDDPQWTMWAKAVMANLKAMPDQVDKKTGNMIPKQSPIKRELDENDQPTGRFYVTFKTSEKYKPGVIDKYGNPVLERVGNGSQVVISYIENAYVGFGGGINFYLNGVQVRELVGFQPQSAASYGFSVEEGGDKPPDENDIPF